MCWVDVAAGVILALEFIGIFSFVIWILGKGDKKK